MNNKLKILLILIISIFATNCSNTKQVMISDSVKRVDKYNSEGNFLRSYFKKFNKELNQWYPANCFNNEKECEYTKLALIQIKSAIQDLQREDVVDNQDFSNKELNKINDNQKKHENQEEPNIDLNFDQDSPKIENERCDGGPDTC